MIADHWMSSTVRVPGKAMVMGEYSVLEGGPAIVAAVSCYATAQLSKSFVQGFSSPLLEAGIQIAKEALRRRGIPPLSCTPIIDTSSFFLGGKKLGLGSSAAVCVATIGSMFCAAELSMSSTVVRSEIQLLALKAQQKVQGQIGSGADILACVWGGIQTLNSMWSPPHTLPLRLKLISTRTPVSTPELVYLYRSAGRKAVSIAKIMEEATAQFLRGFQGSDLKQILDAVELAFSFYQSMGSFLQFRLVTEDHELIYQSAKSVGGAAKPSGAGGGDIAIAFFPTEEAEAEFAMLLPPHLRILPFEVDNQGLCALNLHGNLLP